MADVALDTKSVYDVKLEEFKAAGLELCHPTAEDVPAITNLINASAPDAEHAAYFAAMLVDNHNDSCLVVKDETGKIVGTTLGIEQTSFQKDDTREVSLFLSHIVSDEGEKARIAKEMMVHQTFRNAAQRGVKAVRADLDVKFDPVINDAMHIAAEENLLPHRLYFKEHEGDFPVVLFSDLQGDLPFPKAASGNPGSMRPFLAPTGALGGDIFDGVGDRLAAFVKPQAEPAVVEETAKVHRFPTHREDLMLRHPTREDAQAMLDVVLATNAENPKGGLDIYALSSYERMAGPFSETSMIAEENGKVVGFITGFLLPGKDDPELFIWQIGVPPEHQGKGIGPSMQIRLAEQLNVQRILTTIEGVNEQSQGAFWKLAGYMGSKLEPTGQVVSGEILGNGHDTEIYFEIVRDLAKKPMPRLQ